jgi:hypothetical protein
LTISKQLAGLIGGSIQVESESALVMIEGNKKLAMSTHVLDVYDHFAWRWTLKGGETDGLIE